MGKEHGVKKSRECHSRVKKKDNEARGGKVFHAGIGYSLSSSPVSKKIQIKQKNQKYCTV